VGLFEAARIALVQPIFDGLAGQQTVAVYPLLTAYFPKVSLWTTIAILMVLFTILKGLALFFSNYLLTSVGQRVIVQLRQELFTHILRQSADFFARHRSTDLTTHIISDVERVQQAVTVLLSDTLRESFTLLALLTYAFYLNWQLATFSLVVVPLVYSLTVRFGRRLRRTSHSTQEGIQEVLSIAQEVITGQRVVKAFVREAHEGQRFHNSLVRLQATNMRTARALYLSSPILELVGFLLLATLIFLAQHLISKGSLTLGSFTALLAALFKLYDPMRKLSQTHNAYQQIFAASTRVFALLDEHTETLDHPKAQPLVGFQQALEFSAVSFRYLSSDRPTTSFALRDINLVITKGQVVAVVGLSGSGKTTLTNLLMRFYEPTSGNILLDNYPLNHWRLADLRQQIAWVSQEVVLFNDTIHHNIAYGQSSSREAVIQAAQAAYAHDFIVAAGGYDIFIGENGSQLSGGQRQRLAIARAILKNAPILILDEATSALDSESELQVQQALTNLMRDRTTIVIAHRLSTIRRADKIVVLDHGQIVETGSHEVLLQQQGLYQKLYDLQFSGEQALAANRN
jgi:subfamily B ATP-binding cassette protein MsbA